MARISHLSFIQQMGLGIQFGIQQLQTFNKTLYILLEQHHHLVCSHKQLKTTQIFPWQLVSLYPVDHMYGLKLIMNKLTAAAASV